MRSARKKQLLVFGALVASVVLWTVLLWRFDARTLVDFVGAENGYLVMFLIAAIGGVSSVGGVSYFATLVTLAAGGLNPALLALASGAGISIGDSVYFYLGRHGRAAIEGHWLHNKIEHLACWLDHKPRWLTSLVVYLYTGFTPLPNDLLSIAMGLARRPYLYVVPAMVAGNITLTFLIATLGDVVPFL